MSRIAVIGLGNMGLPMALNLAKAGHELQVYDTFAAALDQAKAAGMRPAASAAEAVAGAEAVVTMLPNGRIVLQVYEEIIPAAAPGALMIDCSTIDLASARAVHRMAAEAGLRPLDAPVSGGTGGAAAGKLTFMVGGTAAAFEAARPVLAAMGARLVHCGEGGAGQAAKACNNMLLAISMIGACEAFSLAERLGLSAQVAFDVMSSSTGSCWSVNSYCPVPGVGPESPADHGYRPGFAAELMAKDLRLAQDAAAGAGQATPLGAQALGLYEDYLAAGGRGRDFSGIINYLKSLRLGADEAVRS